VCIANMSCTCVKNTDLYEFLIHLQQESHTTIEQVDASIIWQEVIFNHKQTQHYEVPVALINIPPSFS